MTQTQTTWGTIDGVMVQTIKLDTLGIGVYVHRLFGGKAYGVDEIQSAGEGPVSFMPWYEVPVNEPWKREEVYYRENGTVVHRDSLDSAIKFIQGRIKNA